jgi:hypothetical protein
VEHLREFLADRAHLHTVDRILNQQKVERLAREAEFREQRAREDEKHRALTKVEKDRAVRELQDVSAVHSMTI